MRTEVPTLLCLALTLFCGDAAHICHHGIAKHQVTSIKEAASNVTSTPSSDDVNAMTLDNNDAYVTVPSNSDDDSDNDVHEPDHRGKFLFPAEPEIKEMPISGTGLRKF